MATYALIHGGGDSSHHWHLLVPELETRGHAAVAVDLPCDDERAGWTDYADAVVAAVGDRRDVIVAAHSLGGFTGPLVAERIPVELMVLVAAMVPLPGERGDDWTTNTGYPGPEGEDEIEIFYDDVDPDVARAALKHGRDQAEAVGREPWPLGGWPDIATRFLLCERDRMFPAAWMREVVRTRLGIEPDVIEGGHCPALSRPGELAERLEAYRKELEIG